MGLSTPKNPPMLSQAIATPVATGAVFNALIPGTQVNQIHGTAPNNSVGAGIPKQVSNVQVSIANAQKGATCTIAVLFQRDPSDKSFSGVNIWVKGYQGNAQLVQVASGSSSPAKFVLNNTGETVSFTIQAFGNGGNAPINSAPTSSGTLPKSTTGGYGTGTTNYYNVNNPPPAGTVAAKYMLGAGHFEPSPAPIAGQKSITDLAFRVTCTRFNSGFSLTNFNTLSFSGRSGIGGGTNFALGIYDDNQKLIWSSGILNIPNTANPQAWTFTVPNLTLPPGTYIYAITGDNINMVSMGLDFSVLSFDSGSSDGNVINQHVINFGYATNAAAAGPVLPATLGGLVAYAVGNSFGSPLMFLEHV